MAGGRGGGSRDGLGFLLDQSPSGSGAGHAAGWDPQAATAGRAASAAAEAACAARWRGRWPQLEAQLVAGGGIAALKKGRQRGAHRELKRMCRGGVPRDLRKAVWLRVSGALERQRAAEAGYYHRLLTRTDALDPVVKRQIEGDLHRTYPKHPVIDTPEGIGTLGRILSAFAVHDPHVGYVQGLNFITGLILIVLGAEAEEQAFWVLASAVEDKMYKGCYAPDLNGCHVEQRVLRRLIKSKVPKVHRKMKEFDCNIILFTTEWFLCLFTRSMPAETAARIWDAFLLEGSKVLFRVALALFKSVEDELAETTNIAEMLQIVRGTAQGSHDRERVMRIAFSRQQLGSFPMRRITAIRAEVQEDVDLDLAKFAEPRT